MNINNAFPSKYLKSGDIEDGADLVLTISRVVIEDVGQGADAERKPIVYFTETEKGLVLNKVNATSISNLHGPETDGWAGKRIALFCTEVDFAGKQTLALRVRLKAPNGNAPAKVPAKISVNDAAAAWEHEQTKATFLTLCEALGAQADDVRRAFGDGGVMSWMKAGEGRTPAIAAKTLADAIAF